MKLRDMHKDASSLENYLIYGIHIPNRRIYFGNPVGSNEDEFTFDSVALAIRAIDLMVEMSSQPIEIHMHSYGGDPYHMMALKDKILESAVKFKFFGRGRISSAATWILAVCDERFLSEDTTVMVHNGGTYRENETGVTKMTDQTIDAEEDERLQDRLNEIYAENSNYDKDFWDVITQRDCFLTAAETVELGLADMVLPHRKRAKFRVNRDKHLSENLGKRARESLMKKLFKRVKLDKFVKDIKLHIPKEQFEDLPEYDNSEAELQKLDASVTLSEEGTNGSDTPKD